MIYMFSVVVVAFGEQFLYVDMYILIRLLLFLLPFKHCVYIQKPLHQGEA